MMLTQILQKIRAAFYTKAEIDSVGGGTSLDTTIKSKVNKAGDTMTGSLTAPSFIANDIDCTVDSQGDEWIRYSNGIQICWGNMNFGSIEAGGTRDWLLNFPKSFVNSNYIAVCGNSSTGSNWMNNCFITYNRLTTSVQVAITNTASASSANALASLVTIGKWK